MHVDNASGSGESKYFGKNMSAPHNFSYHCSAYIIKYKLNETANGNVSVNVTLILNGFQVCNCCEVFFLSYLIT